MSQAKVGFRYDDAGYFIEPVEIFGDELPDYVTLETWEEPCVKPRFVDGSWTDEGHLPEPSPTEMTVDEKIALLEKENMQLKNSVANLEDMVVMLTGP